jgi:hypothetical protein
MAFWQRVHSDKCFLSSLIPEVTLAVSLLESKSGFEIVLQQTLPENDHLHIGSLWFKKRFRGIFKKSFFSCQPDTCTVILLLGKGD